MTNVELYPYKLRAKMSAKEWGGRNLARVLGKTLPTTGLIGETWEAWEGLVIENGAHCGETLAALIQRDSNAMIGNASGRFPLLFKFIDANDALSVQVHPNDAQANEMENQPFGKTEAWLILHAEPGARLVYGFNRDVDRATVAESIREKKLVDLLTFVPVVSGDVIFVPAGTVHAIGKGIVLAEIQQSSDTTYRFYDWDRQSKERPLHIEQSLAVTQFTHVADPKISPLTISHPAFDQTFLTACRYFSFERWTVRERMDLVTQGRFRIISAIAGRATIHAHTSIAIGQGETILLPAQMGAYSIVPETANCVLLAMSVPDLQRDVVEPLTRAGFDDRTIVRLGGLADLR